MKICHACKRELTIERKPGRRDECPSCHADLHCCLNCAFYDPAAPKQCREPMAEMVKEKSKANFCDYFVFKEAGPRGPSTKEGDKARKSLEDLFKK